MDKTYDPQAIEQRWYQFWEQNQFFKPQSNPEATPYCIVIPPPNVTGHLHMGHGFQHSLMDTLIRYQRMQGRPTLWLVGTDHAGISTQMVVERQLAQNGKTRYDLGREKFIETVWEWKKQSGSNITQQMRRMGTSVDWSRERFTLDENLSKAVLKVFIDLFDEGLIYRGKRLVNWDPHFQSAISDLEVINTEEEGKLWHIRYPYADGDGYVIVATTRPETMLGDVAVAVHPNDERYQHLLGKQLRLPLTNRTIPVIADDYVDAEFGSGCVKITPAHDFNDYQVGLRHKLDPINIFTETAKINENAPAAYRGLERFDAREKIIADLTKLNLIEKIEAHKLNIPRADRGNTIIEPYLTDQWFVKTAPLAEPAIAAVKTGKISFVPDNWNKTYFQWLENIEDWCISRQLWWGHRIPAWYDDAGNIYVAENEKAVRAKYKLTENLPLHQDEDVLDTWFSSALWPFSTLGWPEITEDLKTFYPTNVLVTGFDIIFFWVARMIMMGLKFTGQVPFHQVYFHGLIRDADGQKMSKTKGNVLDPLDLIDGIDLEKLIKKRTFGLMQPQMAEKIEKNTRKEFPSGIPSFGADALRFTYCALATPGRDIRFDLSRLEGYRNFANKLWNAARYVLMNVENKDIAGTEITLSIADKWIQSQLQTAIKTVRKHLEDYRFDLCAQTLYEFVWHEFCDWYLELSKPVLTDVNATAAQQLGTRKTLINTLESILRLLHPFMPFITEEIWQQLKIFTDKNAAQTIMLEPYPQTITSLINPKIDADISWLKQVIMAIRNIRGEMTIAPGKLLPIIINKANAEDKNRINENKNFLISLAKLASIEFFNPNEASVATATALVGDMELLIPLAGLIDTAAETKRLTKEIDKLRKDAEKSQAKLANANFIDKAPVDVITQEKNRLAETVAAIKQLEEKMRQLVSSTIISENL